MLLAGMEPEAIRTELKDYLADKNKVVARGREVKKPI